MEKLNQVKIELHPFAPSDREALAQLMNGADRRYLSDRLPSPYTLDSADWWLEHIAQEEKEGKGLFRAIAADGRLAGNISVERKEDVYRLDGELGYLLDRSFWGRGIATLAVGHFCREVFERLNLERITAAVYAPNIASCRVLEKNGFSLEGTIRRGVVKNGAICDLCLYGLLREEAAR